MKPTLHCQKRTKYWSTAISSLIKNMVLDVAEYPTRQLEFTKQWLAFGLSYDNRLHLKQVQFADLYPGSLAIPISLSDLHYRNSNVNPFELYCLSCIVKLRSVERIFEIGTFDGATTLQLARSNSRSHIFTLDLPADGDLGHLATELVRSEAENVQQGGVGARYHGTPQAAQIDQLFGDSTRFDYTPYLGTMDLVFVDACHEYPFVRTDSLTALHLLRSNGIIVWHDDVQGWPGVTRVLHELTNTYPIVQIAGTSLAILDTALPSETIESW